MVPERDRDAETVRRRDRLGDFTFDDGELVQSSRVRVAALREFDDGDPLLRAPIRKRHRRAPSPCDLLDDRLGVVGKWLRP